MPICIECCYPVPQLYHVLSSKKKTGTPGSDAHSRKTSGPAGGSGAGGASGSGGATASSSSHLSSAGNQHGRHNHHKTSSSLGLNSNQNEAGAGAGGGGGFKGGGEAKKSKSSNTADVRLTQCPRCKRFADKYVEHDLVVLFIDLVLVKPQVYRHLLFNRLTAPEDGYRFDPAIQRLGVLLVLFDVYLTWSAIELSGSPLTEASPVPRLPVLGQYLFYLILCSSTALVQHLVIRELSQLRWFRGLSPYAISPFNSNTGSYGTPTHSAVGGGAANHSSHGSMATNNTSAGPSSSPKKQQQQQQQHQHKQSHQSPTTAPSPSPFSSPSSRPASAASSYTQPGTPYMASSGSTSFASSNSQYSHSPYPASTSSTQTGVTSSSHPLPPPPRKNAVSTAIFVSSCMKLFPILMVVWKYEDSSGQLAKGVGWAVAWQNIEALRILLGCGYGPAAIIVGLGWAVSFVVGQTLLAAAGLARLEWGGFVW